MKKEHNFKYKFYYRWKKMQLSDVRTNRVKASVASVCIIAVAILVGLLLSMAIYQDTSLFYLIPQKLFGTAFSKNSIEPVFSTSAILIVSGLAFIVAFKSGLFNIGISGQMTAGASVASIIAILIGPACPNVLGQFLVLIVAIMVGGFVGWIIGALKAYLNVNEVISSIMINWIVYYISALFLGMTGSNSGSPSNSIDVGDNFRLAIGGQSFIPLLIIAFLLMFFVWVLLTKTILGKKMSVIGLSKDQSMGVGYKPKRNIMWSMTISGGLAGVLGVMTFLGQTTSMDIAAATLTLAPQGFWGISIALISMCNIIAIIPIALLYGIIQGNAPALSAIPVDPTLPDFIFGIVVYGSAIISLLIMVSPIEWTQRLFYGKKMAKRLKEERIHQKILLDCTSQKLISADEYYELYSYLHANPVIISKTRKITPEFIQYLEGYKGKNVTIVHQGVKNTAWLVKLKRYILNTYRVTYIHIKKRVLFRPEINPGSYRLKFVYKNSKGQMVAANNSKLFKINSDSYTINQVYLESLALDHALISKKQLNMVKHEIYISFYLASKTLKKANRGTLYERHSLWSDHETKKTINSKEIKAAYNVTEEALKNKEYEQAFTNVYRYRMNQAKAPLLEEYNNEIKLKLNFKDQYNKIVESKNQFLKGDIL